MRQTYQYRELLTFFLSLICLVFPLHISAKNVIFDPSFTEFFLKNASPLISQIEKKKGLGYKSLKNQFDLTGCHSDQLHSPELLEITEAYELNSKLKDLLSKCNTNLSAQEYDLQQLLKNKDPYLIIAGESLNSPMSYFGHSLLLFLDKKDFYFSPVISVLAPTEGLSTFEQIGKGGFSFIHAELNVIPLHQVIDFYNDQESRNLRFIKLPKSTFNTEKLVNYFDSQLSDQLTYNFFTRNCSTYLYDALNYACDCFENSPSIITPVFIEKKVQQHLTSSSRFEIHSLFNTFNKGYQALHYRQRNLVKDMFFDNDRTYLSHNKKVGDVAVLASRLSFESYHNPNQAYTQLLTAYGKDNSLLSELPISETTSDESLDTVSISSAKISIQEKSINIKLSAIDFDHFEQRPHHFISSKLSAGTIELTQTKESTSLNALELLNIQAITPLNFVTKKPSWRLKLGIERNDANKLEGVISTGVGVASNAFELKMYVLPSIELRSTLKFPVYSGVQLNTKQLSIKYEIKNLDEHSLTFYRRENSAFGYEYNVFKQESNDPQHQFTLSYYF
ncbi:hypothetical protein MUS1_11265 [Marinomonas ushuaiensis DSM 15871]|uniref:Uncharacterized protein n=1 Tax=Marinomonas ushuaiensis DSM 15871 TaxID=1122207 RepID=X7E8C4_9GAMM|nr:DUF4105 domain-containing protein [Marinomonas ushuaiensis]ETX11411.1 hypothetical protein MUS1_11265 [Marinomonas ushuaiensis DSM 15871]